jgi:Fic family protein
MTGNICDSPAAVNGDATPSQKKFRLKAKIHKAHGDRRRRLTYADACVAYFIIDWFNPAKGCSWPSLETLAKATGLNLRTVKRSIARLVRLGVIKKKTRGRRGHTSEYVPNWEYGGEPDTQKYGGESLTPKQRIW